MQVYEEFYYSAHDTLPLVRRSAIDSISNSFYGDTIPIAVMDYDFYYCIGPALETPDYFIFDTINDLLYDNPNAIGSPFGRSNIFAAAIMKPFSNFANPVFRIDPALFFTDDVNSPYYSLTNSFRINFEDGTGWHYFDINTVSHYQPVYTTEGKRVIIVELVDKFRRTLKSSKSDVNILRRSTAVPPDEVLNYPGMDVGVYNSCNEETGDKVIIYLEGIDLLDFIPSRNRTIGEIYYQMIESEYIGELRNFGYTYYVVDWKKSTIDMRFNALYTVNLIEILKKKYQYTDEQFVIIGESMGGVIARYALAYMETKAYQTGDYSPFFQEASVPANVIYIGSNPSIQNVGHSNRDPNLVGQMHKTREFISLDSPHQGANIPLSIQHLYKSAMKKLKTINYENLNPYSWLIVAND